MTNWSPGAASHSAEAQTGWAQYIPTAEKDKQLGMVEMQIAPCFREQTRIMCATVNMTWP